MNDHKKPVPGIEATANPAPSKGRRRLVKGAMLTAPVVMTLFNGRLAAATSVCDCKNKLLPAQGVDILIANSDSYYREKINLEILVHKTQSDKIRYYDAINGDYYKLVGNVFVPPNSINPLNFNFGGRTEAYKLVTSQNDHGQTVIMTPSCMNSLANQICPV